MAATSPTLRSEIVAFADALAGEWRPHPTSGALYRPAQGCSGACATVHRAGGFDAIEGRIGPPRGRGLPR